ncbi:hypothetical protein AB0K16_22185 [Nonomuraea jabiensis]|uniref:hypothetical protein n=1 Tax=Nonomuraea jabiensis TaxID=882448 RepID=UPI0034359815
MYDMEAGLLAFRTSVTPYNTESDYCHVYASAVIYGDDRDYDLPLIAIPVLGMDEHDKPHDRILIANAARQLAARLYQVARPHISPDHVYTYVALTPRHRSLSRWYATTCPLTGVRFLVEAPDGHLDQAKALVELVYAGTRGAAPYALEAIARLRQASPS